MQEVLSKNSILIYEDNVLVSSYDYQKFNYFMNKLKSNEIQIEDILGSKKIDIDNYGLNYCIETLNFSLTKITQEFVKENIDYCGSTRESQFCFENIFYDKFGKLIQKVKEFINDNEDEDSLEM